MGAQGGKAEDRGDSGTFPVAACSAGGGMAGGVSRAAGAGAVSPRMRDEVGAATASAWACVGWMERNGLEKACTAGGDETAGATAAGASEFGFA